MILLTIDNSECKIEGLTVEQHKALKDILSYILDSQSSYFSGGYGPRKYSLLSNKGVFPTGLLEKVFVFIDDRKLLLSIHDVRRAPKRLESSFKLSLGFAPYKHQVEAVEACRRTIRGVVSAVTGFGKSVTMAILVQKLQLKTLIVVPNLELKRQLQESFIEYFGTLQNITIENIDSRTLSRVEDYGCLIIDEAHHVAAKTYRTLNKKFWKGIYHRYFFTATPFRSKEEEQILFESIAGDVIYSIDYHEAVKNNYIVPMEAYYYEIPRTTIQGSSWSSVYSQLVVNHSSRNDIIANLLGTLRNSGYSTVCLVKEIKHGGVLSDLSKTFFANGKNEDTGDLIKFFSMGKIKGLIGTTGVLGEGVDTKPAEYIIIAGLGKSKTSFMQQVGRGFRKYPGKESCKIILFLDRSHKFGVSHFKAQCKHLLDEYGVVPIKLTFD